MKFDHYSDPGHGWAKVPRKLLVKLGIEDQITHFSYQRGDWCYLEEDCDLDQLAHALCARGVNLEWRRHFTDKRSKIRGYEHFLCLGSEK